ncbi:MAG: cadherin-like domain-containing protein [Oscillospiraceae bacterium]|nr:cadherin-like domain-containing protein [Oscillospiraceae bacterium]
MFQTKFLCLVLCACLTLSIAGGAVAAQVDCDDIYCFSSGDFSSDDKLEGICITGLPDSSAGTIVLGSRVLRPGDILTAEQVAQMTFVPLLTETDAEAQVTYLPIYADRVERATAMTISIRGKADKAPIAENSSLQTYKNLANEGTLKVSDPEGLALTYTVTRQAKRGTVTIREDGTFLYTPKKNKVGTDSFVYTATDPAGHVSREATVTIEIMKPGSAAMYTDTANTDCRFEAEWLRNTGLFVGEQIGGKSCFQPEKAVSRGEFLTMLVKTLGIEVDEEAAYTGFNDEIPMWLKPYLSAALRSGLTVNWPHGTVFGANEPIDGMEAALLTQNALDLTVTTMAGKDEETDIPSWAITAMNAMADNGFSLTAGTLTRAEAAVLLYQVSRIAPTAPGMKLY